MEKENKSPEKLKVLSKPDPFGKWLKLLVDYGRRLLKKLWFGICFCVVRGWEEIEIVEGNDK